MPGTLYVVATPIGNLEDITLRALRTLREVHLIAAEDTRRTARLLARHAVKTPTISFHEHNTRARLPQLLARLTRGESIAVVTDAGTPGLSDPGVELVQACLQAAIAVEPVPGVSAPLAAAVASGFPLTPMTIWGFPPSRPKDRSRWIADISTITWTMTLFEAPHRIASTLRMMGDILGNRHIMVARELTKVHQEFLRGSARELSETVSAGKARGEFTVVIGPTTEMGPVQPLDDARIAAEFGRVADSGRLSRRAAIAATAKILGVSPNDVYAAVERVKGS